MHGPGNDSTSFGGIRNRALQKAKPPAQGGNETTYLNAFLDARVETGQRAFLRNGNLNLNAPLKWKVYGDSFHIG